MRKKWLGASVTRCLFTDSGRCRPTVTGREKIIAKSEQVDYISVHKVLGKP